MLTPDYLLHISEGAEEIAEQLHQDIINRIVERMMIRLGRGDSYLLTAQDKWQLEVLQEAGYLLEDLQAEIAKRTKQQQEEIASAMEDAGVTALSYDDAIYKAVGLSPTPLTQSPSLIRIMQRNYEATMGEWKNFTRTTVGAAQTTFISAMDKAYNLTLSGAVSYTQAVREAINDIESNGVEVIYPTGHKDTIETATLRAVRTGISQASGQIQIARMNEMDVDLVLVSSHMGARPEHHKWQGKVYSRGGKSSKYPDFVESTGYGSVDGLCGANCRHNFGPYFEGMDNPFEQYDTAENRKAYELQQKQRAYERRIRKTKREVMGKKTAIDNCKDDKLKYELDLDYQRKASLLQKQNKAYNDFCEENGLKKLNDRIQVAKWDREQAAKARGAAKRYEAAKGSSNVSSKKVNASVRDMGDTEIKVESFAPAQKEELIGSYQSSGNNFLEKFAEDSTINVEWTDTDTKAINDYMSAKSYVVNEKLRIGETLSDEEREFVQNLDNALEKLPRYSGNLQRTLFFYSDDDIALFIKDYKKGDSITYKEYLSTTRGAVYNPEGQVQIYIQDARNGCDISTLNEAEQEVLYKRNSNFEIMNVVEIDGVYNILLEEKGDE